MLAAQGWPLMFRRYHHGHSVIMGAVLTLALERHALVFALLLFAAGLVVGRTWATTVMIAGAVRDRVLHASKRQPVDTRPVPVYSIAALKSRARRGAQTDEIPF